MSNLLSLGFCMMTSSSIREIIFWFKEPFCVSRFGNLSLFFWCALLEAFTTGIWTWVFTRSVRLWIWFELYKFKLAFLFREIDLLCDGDGLPRIILGLNFELCLTSFLISSYFLKNFSAIETYPLAVVFESLCLWFFKTSTWF